MSQTSSIDCFSFLGCLGQGSRNVFCHLLWAESRDSSVSIVTRLWSGQSGVWCPAGARDIWLLENAQTSPGTHPATYSIGTGVLPWDRTVRMSSWPLTYLNLVPPLRIGAMLVLLLICLDDMLLCFNLPWVR
jgi:hypothetical protein